MKTSNRTVALAQLVLTTTVFRPKTTISIKLWTFSGHWLICLFGSRKLLYTFKTLFVLTFKSRPPCCLARTLKEDAKNLGVLVWEGSISGVSHWLCFQNNLFPCLCYFFCITQFLLVCKLPLLNLIRLLTLVNCLR